MPSLRRLLLAFAFALLLGWVCSGTVRALNEAEAPPNTPALPELRVKLDLQNGESAEHIVAFESVKVVTANGNYELRVGRVKSLTLEARDNEIRAVVELNNHDRIAGKLLTNDFTFRDGNTTKTIPAAQVSRLSFQHPKETGFFALVLGLVTLTLMEIVLGIDNIIFLAIVAGKLPPAQQPRARRIGLAAALGTRLLLLASLSFLLGLTRPLFHLPELGFLQDPEARAISWRDLILLVGGLFLIGKSTMEMREKVEHAKAKPDEAPRKPAKFAQVILQIAIIDIIFSLDSVITAVGMVGEIWVMVTAMLLAVGVMMIFAEPISRFVDRNPTIKVLALSFLILIGVLLVAEGLGQHLDKGYIYFAMAFALVVEIINMKLRPKVAKPTPDNE